MVKEDAVRKLEDVVAHVHVDDVLWSESRDLDDSSKVAQAAVVVVGTVGSAPAAAATGDVLEKLEASRAALQIADHRPTVRRQSIPQHVPGVWDRHPLS